MWNSENTFDAEVQYAIRMVQTRCATVEQAAASCGLRIEDLQARLDALTQCGVEVSPKEKFFAGLTL